MSISALTPLTVEFCNETPTLVRLLSVHIAFPPTVDGVSLLVGKRKSIADYSYCLLFCKTIISFFSMSLKKKKYFAPDLYTGIERSCVIFTVLTFLGYKFILFVVEFPLVLFG